MLVSSVHLENSFVAHESSIHSAILDKNFMSLFFKYLFKVKVLIVFVAYFIFVAFGAFLDQILVELNNYFCEKDDCPEDTKRKNDQKKANGDCETLASKMNRYQLYSFVFIIIFVALLFKMNSSLVSGFLKELIFSDNISNLHDILLFLNANSIDKVDNYMLYDVHENIVNAISSAVQLTSNIFIALVYSKKVIGNTDDSPGVSEDKKYGIGIRGMFAILFAVCFSISGHYLISKNFRKQKNIYKNTYNEISRFSFIINRRDGLNYCNETLSDIYDEADWSSKLNELKVGFSILSWTALCFLGVYLVLENKFGRDALFRLRADTWLPIKTFVISIFMLFGALTSLMNSTYKFYDICDSISGFIRSGLPNKSIDKLNNFSVEIDKLYVGAHKFDGFVSMFGEKKLEVIKNAINSENMVKIYKMINSVENTKNRNILLDAYDECLLFKDIKCSISNKELTPSLVVDKKILKTVKIIAHDRLLQYDNKLIDNDYIKVGEFGDSIYISDNKVFYNDKPLSISGFYVQDNKLFYEQKDKKNGKIFGVEVTSGSKLMVRDGSVMSVFVGPSGGGKSTIVQYLFGLRFSRQVKTKINGINLKDVVVSDLSKHVGEIPQSPIIFENLTVMQNFGCFGATNEQKNIKVLKELGIYDVLRRAIENDTLLSNVYMSGGQKVRFSLAMALASDTNPDFLLIDEAISSLSPDSQSELVGLFNTWNKAFVVIEHVGKFIDIANIKVSVGNGGLKYMVRFDGEWIDVFELKNLNKKNDFIICDDATVYVQYNDINMRLNDDSVDQSLS